MAGGKPIFVKIYSPIEEIQFLKNLPILTQFHFILKKSIFDIWSGTYRFGESFSVVSITIVDAIVMFFISFLTSICILLWLESRKIKVCKIDRKKKVAGLSGGIMGILNSITIAITGGCCGHVNLIVISIFSALGIGAVSTFLGIKYSTWITMFGVIVIIFGILYMGNKLDEGTRKPLQSTIILGRQKN